MHRAPCIAFPLPVRGCILHECKYDRRATPVAADPRSSDRKLTTRRGAREIKSRGRWIESRWMMTRERGDRSDRLAAKRLRQRKSTVLNGVYTESWKRTRPLWYRGRLGFCVASCSLGIIGFGFGKRKFRIVGGRTKFAYTKSAGFMLII